MASSSARVARAPPAPVAAAPSAKSVQQFQELKRSLGEHVSWELTGDSYDKLWMNFTEAGNEQQAKTFAAILK